MKDHPYGEIALSQYYQKQVDPVLLRSIKSPRVKNSFPSQSSLPPVVTKMFVWRKLLFVLAAMHVASGTWVKGTGTVTRFFSSCSNRSDKRIPCNIFFIVMAIRYTFSFY